MSPIPLLIVASLAQGNPPLSIQDAVRVALSNSPKMQAAKFEAQAAKAGLEKERPVARPSVGVSAEGRLQGPRVTFPKAGAGDANAPRPKPDRKSTRLN